MRLVPDPTGRLAFRPFFGPGELDQRCEAIIVEFVRLQCRQMVLPVPTDCLTKLIERDAADLDLYADLKTDGSEVHGRTDFFVKRKPKVCIARELSEQPWRENRLRTTLAHEYGHVRFHAPLWDQHADAAVLFSDVPEKSSPKCKRDAIIGASSYDWMEWQAGYVSGAILMPVTPLREAISEYRRHNGIHGALVAGTPEAQSLQRSLGERFAVSEEAARVRLFQLSYLARSSDGQEFLF